MVRRINVHCAVIHSLHRFLFIFFNVLYSRFPAPFAAPFASSFAAPFAAPFPIHFPQFSLFKLRYAMFAAPLAIRSSPIAEPFAIRRAMHCRFSMSPDTFHTNYEQYLVLRMVITILRDFYDKNVSKCTWFGIFFDISL